MKEILLNAILTTMVLSVLTIICYAIVSKYSHRHAKYVLMWGLTVTVLSVACGWSLILVNYAYYLWTGG